MKNTISFKRIFLLLKSFVRLNVEPMKICSSIYIATMLLAACISVIGQAKMRFAAFAFLGILAMYSILWSPLIFNNLKARKNITLYLTLPASSLEKFIAYFIIINIINFMQYAIYVLSFIIANFYLFVDANIDFTYYLNKVVSAIHFNHQENIMFFMAIFILAQPLVLLLNWLSVKLHIVLFVLMIFTWKSTMLFISNSFLNSSPIYCLYLITIVLWVICLCRYKKISVI